MAEPTAPDPPASGPPPWSAPAGPAPSGPEPVGYFSPPLRREVSLRLGDIAVVLGSLLVFGFSFAPFVQYSESAQDQLWIGQLDISPAFNAWSPQTFMVPLTTFVIFASLLASAATAVRFGLRRDPLLLGFRLRQLEVGLTMFAFVVLLAMMTSPKEILFGIRRLAEADPGFAVDTPLTVGWGAVLMLIGAALALTGAILNHFSIGLSLSMSQNSAAPPPGPPPYAHPPYHQPPPVPPQPPPPGQP